jgi:hypothetical protein
VKQKPKKKKSTIGIIHFLIWLVGLLFMNGTFCYIFKNGGIMGIIDKDVFDRLNAALGIIGISNVCLLIIVVGAEWALDSVAEFLHKGKEDGEKK